MAKKPRTITALTTIKTILNKQVGSFAKMSVNDLLEFEKRLAELNKVFSEAEEARAEEIIKAKEEELKNLKEKFKK